MKAMSDPIIRKNKKKRLLMISYDDLPKDSILNQLVENSNLIERKKIDNEEILMVKHSYKHKSYCLKITQSSGNTKNTNYITACDGIIFVYSKICSESLKYICEFLKNYHRVIGNKFFPCIFVETDLNPVTELSTPISRRELEEVTLNESFPVIKIKNLDKEECTRIYNSILDEIIKESNDEFPYSLAYQDQIKINYCIRHKSLFDILLIVHFMLIMLFSLFDTLFILSTPDFINESQKVDDVFLGIRLNVNSINFLCGLIFIKYSLFDRDKYNKIGRLEKYALIANIISYFIQFLLHIRIRHVKIFYNEQLLSHNESYYSIKIYQIFTFTLYILSFTLIKFLNINANIHNHSDKNLIRSNSNDLGIQIQVNRNYLSYHD